MLGIKPWEFHLCTIGDLIDMWDAYNSTLVYSKDNTIQAQANYRLSLIAHLLSQQGSKSPKPFKQEPSDFLFKPRVNGREEAEDWINND